MNIQAMLNQAQKMQKEMTTEQNKINEKVFTSELSFVKITANGKKEIQKIKIDKTNLDSDDIEMLEDVILTVMNNLFKDIDKETEEKLGKLTKGLPGMF